MTDDILVRIQVYTFKPMILHYEKNPKSHIF